MKKKTSEQFAAPLPTPTPTFEAGVIAEPLLLFGGHSSHIDPKTGVGLYGPYTLSDQENPPIQSVTLGLVGSKTILTPARSWLDLCRRPVLNDGRQPFLYPHFPGFSLTSPFQCDLRFGDTWQEVIDDVRLASALKETDPNKRVAAVVALYANAIHNLSERQPKPNVILCLIPKDVADGCHRFATAPRFHPVKRTKRRVSLQQLLFAEPADPDEPIHENLEHYDLRRALKAEAMAFGIPTQLLLEESFRTGAANRQDPATTAWNFFTALYHKADGHPWRLADAQSGTCYVGISFFRERDSESPQMRTSLAQAFTHAGDGFVLRGKPFQWDRSQGPSPHLGQADARDLITEVINVYTRHKNVKPERVVVHKSSRYQPAELAGFREALQGIPYWDLVALGRRGTQFLRLGQYPPLRGTWVRFDDSNYLLYTQGYVPFLRTYPGMRAPQPQEMLELYGTSPAETVLREILALTKLNWNSADFACHQPITLAFSRRVGEILTELPPRIAPQKDYKFYM